MAPPPFIAMPYPLDEYLDQLDRDYERITKRLLRAANWERGPSPCGRYELDAGEALIDERSEKLWGSLRLERVVKASGRRSLVHRVLEKLERDGWIDARPANQGNEPGSEPKNGPRNGPIPTRVRWLKYRDILWPASVRSNQTSDQETDHDSDRRNAPILPASPPAPPAPPEVPPPPPAPARAARPKRAANAGDPRHRPLQERLERVFSEARHGAAYGFQPRDAKALTDLLRLSGGDDGETERRWRMALGEVGFRRCDTLHELATKWNAYTAPAAPANRAGPIAAMPAAAFSGRSGGFQRP